MGKNLAGTTITAYSGSSPQETVHVNGFCRTEISSCTGSQRPHCQVEGCIANMSSAKHYHRRHKVCEFHSKASTVVVGGHIQRFCQQCSRCEFDEKKRSCRKSLADHNRRRRKPQPSPFTASQCQAGTAALENGKQETGITSSHDATGLQIIPNINTSISTAPFWIASVTPQSSVPMMISPKTYKGQIPVLQGASNDKTRCVDYLYANIEQTGANLSREKRILSDRQIDSREYQLVHPCSLNCGLLSSEITGHIAWPAPKDIQYSQSLISVNNSHSNVHVIETSKSSLNRRIFSSSNYNPVALSSMKNGGSNWILNGSSAEVSTLSNCKK